MSTPQPGFVMPQVGHAHPFYPTQPQQAPYPYPYPPQQQVVYPPPAFNHQPFPAPIQQQPGFGPTAPPNWFINTDFAAYLRGASSFHVKQKVELLEAIVGWEQENKYTVKDQNGHKVFLVGESSDCLSRQFCAQRRPFTLNVKDLRGVDILRINRKLDCSCCCAAFCPDSITVTTANGQLLGSVEEDFSFLYPKYSIKDSTGKTVLKLKGPMLPCSYRCTSVVFKVKTIDGISVGTISKEWGGLVRELFTDADYFSMSFPTDLDPSIKAVCLAGLFLIDFEYFEAGPGSDQGGRRIFG